MKLKPLFPLFRHEWKEAIYSKLLWLVSLTYIAFLAIFILAGNKESAVLGFTGMNRIIFSWSHALVFFLPLLALVASVTIIIQYRENGGLEFFLSQPISRNQFFLALTCARLLSLLLPLSILLLIVETIGIFLETGFQTDYGIKFFLISSSLLWCFLSLGLYISEKSRSQVRAIVLMILVWMLAVVLLDILLIGMVIKFSPHSAILFFLTELNPVQAARLAMLIELDSSLSTLGPSGFFIANLIGPSPIFLIGFFWPLGLGILFWVMAKRNFEMNDLV